MSIKNNLSSNSYVIICVTLVLLWSILVLCSAIWNLKENDHSTMEKARVEAETIFQHDLACCWNSIFGRVYAEISETNQPNPYLEVGQRDISCADGIQLTTVNPFHMTKQMYGLSQNKSLKCAVFNRIVSLDPLNPENSPDRWEKSALEDFEKGGAARAEMTVINDAPYVRLISPYITEQQCLECHGRQSWEVGDVLGGISIAVPMEPHLKAAADHRRYVALAHFVLWLLGLGILWLLFLAMRRCKSKIEASAEMFRIVSEFAYNFEYWIDENEKLTFISPSCERITGYTSMEFLKKDNLMYDMVHIEDKHLFTLSQDDLKGMPHNDVEYRIVTKQGETRWLSQVSVPVYAEGKFRGRRGSIIDITDKKQLREKLRQAKKVEDIGHFAAGVAHDFNNVLTSISTFSQLLEPNIEKDNIFALELSNNIGIASRLGQNLTSNLLLFGQEQSSSLVKIKLSEVIHNIENVLHVLLLGNVSFKVVIADNERAVKVDCHQIEQVLLNLATNGRDAMPEGGDLTVAVDPLSVQEGHELHAGTIPAGEYMVLSVSDTGSGIEEQVLKNILEPFYSTKSSKKGTGLGLAIVKNIVNQHNAIMEIDTIPGEGTTFRLIFPACEDGTKVGAIESIPPAPLPLEKEGKTILLVDDDWLIRKTICTYLEEMSHTVLVAEDGENAISQYNQHKDVVSLVILDLVLPGMDGTEVYEALKKINPEVRVLFISGASDEDLAEINIFQDTLTLFRKPLDMKKFSKEVGKMLAS